MIICGIDLETTGLSPDKDHIIEMAYVIKGWCDPKPIAVGHSYFTTSIPLTKEIQELTRIDDKLLSLAGRDISVGLSALAHDCDKYGVAFMLGHNGRAFDKLFLQKVVAEIGGGEALDRYLNIPWLDSKEDIIYPGTVKTTRLTYLAAEHGFLNPFPHSALFDVMTMLNVAERYPFDQMVERSKMPTLIVRALVSFDDKQLAKDRSYYWEKWADKSFPKMWVKGIKEGDFDREVKECVFPIAVLERIEP